MEFTKIPRDDNGVLAQVSSPSRFGRWVVAVIALPLLWVTPATAQEWYLADDYGSVITNAVGWQVEVAVDGYNLTVKHCYNDNNSTLLDFSTPIEGGAYSITQIGTGYPVLSYFSGGLVLPDTVTNISAWAFLENTFTGSLAFPDSLTSVGESAFFGGSFEGVTSWGSLDAIPEQMFCTTTITTNLFVVPNQIKSIGVQAFDGCTFGGSVVIGNGVTNIADRALSVSFMGSSMERRISLPSTGVCLGEHVFEGSTVQEVYYSGGYPSATGFNVYNWINPTSYVTASNINDWNPHTSTGNIMSGWDTWMDCPICCGEWDVSRYLSDTPYDPAHAWHFVPAYTPPYFFGENMITNAAGWQAYVDVDGNNLTVYKCNPYYNSNTTLLDFSTPVEDGAYSIVQIGKLGSSPVLSSSSLPPSTCNLILPNTLTNITDAAFESCRCLTGDLVIPDSVVTIGQKAFYHCAFNGSLTLGDSLVSIGGWAFYDNVFAGGLVIPNSVKTLGQEAFCNCYFDGSLALGNSLVSVGYGVFTDTTFEGVSSWGTLDTVWERMFDRVTFTTNLFVISNQIISIEPRAFENCIFGDSVVIGNRVINIGYAAFANVSARRISLPSTGVSLGDYVFGWATIQEVYYRGDYPAAVGNNIYYNNPNLTSYVTTDSVADWNQHAFWWYLPEHIEDGNSYWEGYPIRCGEWDVSKYLSDTHHNPAYDWYLVFDMPPYYPHMITNAAGWQAYVDVDGNNLTVYNCYPEYSNRALLDFSAPVEGGTYSIVQIGKTGGQGILSPYISICSLVLPNTLTNIADGAFAHCSCLMGDLRIPDSVVTIGVSAFRDCAFNGSLTLGDSLVTIGGWAFKDNAFAGGLVIPDSVETIGDGAFYGCSFNGSLTLGNALKTLGDQAFCNCCFNGSLAFGNSLVSVGYGVFADTTFEGVSSWGTLDTVWERMFFQVSFTTNLFVIPNQIISIDPFAFEGCTFGDSMVIGDGVTNIGYSAFISASVRRISLPSTGISLGDYVFGWTTLQEVYYRGDYPGAVGGGIYYYNSYLTSYVTTNSVADWNQRVSKYDPKYNEYIECIEDGNAYWEGYPIRCGEWDVSDALYQAGDVTGVFVTAVNVVGNDVVLTLNSAKVTAKFGTHFDYAVYAFPDLAHPDQWLDKYVEGQHPNLDVSRQTSPHTVTVTGMSPAFDRMFFKVKAEKR